MSLDTAPVVLPVILNDVIELFLIIGILFLNVYNSAAALLEYFSETVSHAC